MREESLKDNLPKATAASKWSSSDFCRDVCSDCAVSMVPRGFLQLVQTDVHGKQAFLGFTLFICTKREAWMLSQISSSSKM